MEIIIHIDDDYMGELMSDVHNPADKCIMESVGILRWMIDVKRSGRLVCMCDRNGQNVQIASIPIIDRVDR